MASRIMGWAIWYHHRGWDLGVDGGSWGGNQGMLDGYG
jgi:hypothetical protein